MKVTVLNADGIPVLCQAVVRREEQEPRFRHLGLTVRSCAGEVAIKPNRPLWNVECSNTFPNGHVDAWTCTFATRKEARRYQRQYLER